MKPAREIMAAYLQRKSRRETIQCRLEDGVAKGLSAEELAADLEMGLQEVGILATRVQRRLEAAE